ncbi:MAG: thymidine phosphorylase, partial [Nanoarchaeota archaeon]
KACFVWGGTLGLAPADDKIIKIEKILKLDPESQLLASILSKKLSVGSTHVLIDIPYGEGAKVSKKGAEKLGERFLWLGKKLGLKIKVIFTLGNQPIGNGIGPALEMMDVLRVLRRDNPPKDLETKALMMAGILIEMVGKAKNGKGEEMAYKLLESGKALKKFEEIVNTQGRVRDGLKLAKYNQTVKAEKSGFVKKIDNKEMNNLATIMGCPVDKGTGIYLFKHIGDKVEKGDDLVTFYAEAKEKLNEALMIFKTKMPIEVK